MRKEVFEDLIILGVTALPHLWKDELGDVFVITRQMEIYVYSKTVLGCYCWHKKTYLQLQKTGVIFDVYETDNKVYYFKTNRENLALLFALGTYKRRPHRNGWFIRSKEILLGHKILPYIIDNSIRKELKKKATGESGPSITKETSNPIPKEFDFA
ncbi:hypothetical protein ACFL60_02930 [Candidatus Omnitrophota bacterium]